MSEYRWRTRGVWIGVKDSEGRLLGIIRRSGTVRALGHFCHVEVSFLGRKYQASGAEDRIFPFHSLKLAPGEALNARDALEAFALGWLADGNTFAFRDAKTGETFACGERGTRIPIDASKLPDASCVELEGGERPVDAPWGAFVHARCAEAFSRAHGIRSTITGAVLEAPRAKRDQSAAQRVTAASWGALYCAHCGGR